MHPIYPLLPDIARSRTHQQQAAATRWRQLAVIRRGWPTQRQTRFRFQSVRSLLLTL